LDAGDNKEEEDSNPGSISSFDLNKELEDGGLAQL